MNDWKSLNGFDGYEYKDDHLRSVNRIVQGRFGDTRRVGKEIMLRGVLKQRKFFMISQSGKMFKVYLSDLK